MDILILVGGFTVCACMGMPVAYALGLAAILAALWIDMPLEAVMLKISERHERLLAARDPVLHPGRRASWPRAAWRSGWSTSPRCSSASSAAAWRWSTSSPRPCSAASRARRSPTPPSIGSVMIPQMIKNGYPRLFAVNVTISGSLQPLLIPPSHNVVHLLARRRRHDLGRASVHGRRHPGAAARACR